MPSCPSEPLPAGWRVWRGPVPPLLSTFAVQVRDRIGTFAYGVIADALLVDGIPVGAFKSHHTWTYRNGQLLEGICIPGIMLVVPHESALGKVAVLPRAPASSGAELLQPDPDIPMWLAAESTSASLLPVFGWAAFALGAVALLRVVTESSLASSRRRFRS